MGQIPEVSPTQIGEWLGHPVTKVLLAAVRDQWTKRMQEVLQATTWEEFLVARGAMINTEAFYQLDQGLDQLLKQVMHRFKMGNRQPLLEAIFDDFQLSVVQTTFKAEEAQREQDHRSGVIVGDEPGPGPEPYTRK